MRKSDSLIFLALATLLCAAGTPHTSSSGQRVSQRSEPNISDERIQEICSAEVDTYIALEPPYLEKLATRGYAHPETFLAGASDIRRNGRQSSYLQESLSTNHKMAERRAAGAPNDANHFRETIRYFKGALASGQIEPAPAEYPFIICAYEALLANVEGRPQRDEKPYGGATGKHEAVKSAVPPLRPTITQEAHNPAGEATDCVRVIYKGDFDVEHVSTTQKAVFRNTCLHPVEVTWCTQTGDCKPGYTNLFTVPARKDRGFSYEPSVRGSKVAYAACFNGFVPHQGELSKKLNHACK